MAEEEKADKAETRPIFASKPKLFGKWDYEEVKIVDPCFKVNPKPLKFMLNIIFLQKKKKIKLTLHSI